MPSLKKMQSNMRNRGRLSVSPWSHFSPGSFRFLNYKSHITHCGIGIKISSPLMVKNCTLPIPDAFLFCFWPSPMSLNVSVTTRLKNKFSKKKEIAPSLHFREILVPVEIFVYYFIRTANAVNGSLVIHLNDCQLTLSFTGFTLYIVFAHGFHFAKSTTPFRIVNNPKATSVFVRNEVKYPFPETQIQTLILYTRDTNT